MSFCGAPRVALSTLWRPDVRTHALDLLAKGRMLKDKDLNPRNTVAIFLEHFLAFFSHMCTEYHQYSQLSWGCYFHLFHPTFTSSKVDQLKFCAGPCWFCHSSCRQWWWLQTRFLLSRMVIPFGYSPSIAGLIEFLLFGSRDVHWSLLIFSSTFGINMMLMSKFFQS